MAHFNNLTFKKNNNNLTFNFHLQETKLDPWVLDAHSPRGSNTGEPLHALAVRPFLRPRPLPRDRAFLPHNTGGRRGLASRFCDPLQNTLWVLLPFQSGLWNKDPEPDTEVCCSKRQRFWGCQLLGQQEPSGHEAAVLLWGSRTERPVTPPRPPLCLPVHPPASPHSQQSSTARPPPDSVKGRGRGGVPGLSLATSLCLCLTGFMRNAPSL